MASKYDFEEMTILRLMELNTLMPHYWSEFFVQAQLMLDDKQIIQLNGFIREVEKFVLEEQFWYNYFKCRNTNCRHKWKTESDWVERENCPVCGAGNAKLLHDRHTLYDLEMAIESNPDYTAYFKRYSTDIYKFDVERKLNDIRKWIFRIIKERASKRRFRRFK